MAGQDIDCRSVGLSAGSIHAGMRAGRPVCPICYNALLRRANQAEGALRRSREDADQLRAELEDANKKVRECALALGRIVEG